MGGSEAQKPPMPVSPKRC